VVRVPRFSFKSKYYFEQKQKKKYIFAKKNNYLPQYIDISFEVNANGDVLVSEDVQKYPSPENQGILVTSGNMLETSNLTEAEKEAKLKSKKGRKYHYIISKQYSSPKPIEISQEAIFNYISALTDFQSGKLFKDNSKNPFDHALGVLKNNRPIFYCQPKLDQPIILFGQSPNFRIPYSPQGNGEASTARDFIPSYLKNSKDKPTINDIAEAILGFVRRDKQPEKINQSCASRVFITDATLQPNQDEKVKSSLNKDPQEIILSSPKPTTFQHYLVQTSDKKPELKHYASQPPTDTEPGETVIRGHKLYWHNKEYKKLEPPENSDTQTSLIKPIDPGIEFTFDIHFENLSDVELGALLWILSLSSDKSQQLETGKTDEKYCFSLGMGKPLGMGAVKINYNFHLSDRTARYSQLFDSNGWSQDEKEQDEVTQAEINCISEFEKYVLDRISENDYPDNQNRQQLEHLRQIPRIEMLLAMLQCDPLKEAAYMELETFKDRKVLPTPLDIRKIEDKRRFPTNSTPSSKTASKPKPQKKSDHPKQEPENKVNLATQRAARPPKPKS
jgi:CRISPR-associated protein (TIGR03986 family)